MIAVDLFHGSENEWDSFASRQDGYTHFHQLRWRTVIRNVFGHECLYMAARDSTGEVVGVLPLVRVRSAVFGHFMVSMPFLNYGGPLGTDDGICALVERAIEIARRDRVKLLEFRSSRPLGVSLPVSHRKITMLLDLARSGEEQFGRFAPKLRSQIRRPQKEGITVEFGSGQVTNFFSVFARHMRDLGTPTQSAKFFHAVAEAFPDDCWFACAYLTGRPVAAACGFLFGDQFEMTWAASLRAFNRESPNMLVYWACMERAIAHGIRTFNFGRCTPGSGTHRFKKQWGAREESLWWYGFASSSNVTTPSPDSGPFRLGPRIWRKLPPSVATAFGPSIVRYIP